MTKKTACEVVIDIKIINTKYFINVCVYLGHSIADSFQNIPPFFCVFIEFFLRNGYVSFYLMQNLKKGYELGDIRYLMPKSHSKKIIFAT